MDLHLPCPDNSLRGLYPTENAGCLLGHASLRGPYMLIPQQVYASRMKVNLLCNVKETAAWSVELYRVTESWKTDPCIVILQLPFCDLIHFHTASVERPLRDYCMKSLTGGKNVFLHVDFSAEFVGLDMFFSNSWLKQNDSEGPNVHWNLLNFKKGRQLSMTENLFSFFTAP